MYSVKHLSCLAIVLVGCSVWCFPTQYIDDDNMITSTARSMEAAYTVKSRRTDYIVSIWRYTFYRNFLTTFYY